MTPIKPGDVVEAKKDSHGFLKGRKYKVVRYDRLPWWSEESEFILDAAKKEPFINAVIIRNEDLDNDRVLANHIDIRSLFKIIHKEMRSPKWL